MTITIAQLANLSLTAGQQTKLQQCKDIGDALIAYRKAVSGSTLPDISVVTIAQAKAVDNFSRDVNALIGAIQTGAQYVRQKTKDDAAATADATPAGTF